MTTQILKNLPLLTNSGQGQNLHAIYRIWQRRRSTRKTLTDLTAAQLKDIGLSAQLVETEIKKYFWQ